MTTEQKLQWIALPGGVLPDGRLRVTVSMSPRLRTDEGTTLALFPDLLNWPACVSAMIWRVDAGGVDLPAEVVSPAPDADLWAALFAPDTPVNAWQFPHLADRPLVTFDVIRVHSQLKRLYSRAAAAAPDSLPKRQTPRRTEPLVHGLDELLSEVVQPGQSHYGKIEHRIGVSAAADRLLANARAEAAHRRASGIRGGDAIHPLQKDSVFEVERAALFHSSPETEPRGMPDGGEHYRATVDFHQMLGALDDYPELRRRLGLAVDLAVRAESVPGPTGFLTAVPTAPPPSPADAVVRESVAHQTAFTTAGGRFVAAREKPAADVPEGLVPLASTGFAVTQVDVDGGALKTIATATTMSTPPPAAGGAALSQSDEAGLSSLRTAGLTLVQTGRADLLQAEFSRSGTINSVVEGGPAQLYAEDLVRAYRLDVFDERTGVWRSLHERVLTATVQRYAPGLTPATGEGQVLVSLAERLTPPGQQPDPDGELYVHEALVSWDGWSLSVPRTGAPLSRHADAPDPDRPETLPAAVPNDPQTAMGLSFTSAAVPGSLPRLRFGRSYRVRLREVDLAGGGPTLREADVLGAGDLKVAPYLRFEPVSAPVTVPYAAYREGASLHRLVIRSDAGTEPGDYAQRFNTEFPDHPGYTSEDVRHLAPPKASYDLAEKHGMFDLTMGSDGTPPSEERAAAVRGAYEIARREKGSFNDPETPGAQVVGIPTPDGTGGEYVVHAVDQLELPYLPDPLAVGVVFRGLPGTPEDEPFRLVFDTADGIWWRAAPLRLRLVGGDGQPEWDAEARVLTVRLPQARTVHVRITSELADLSLMGMARWCEEELEDAELDRVITAMKENRCWLTTPWHDLELVHAVQHPLMVPEWGGFRVSRQQGATYAEVAGTAYLDGTSTMKVDLDAAWTEPVDDAREDGPRNLSARMTVLSMPMDASALVPEGLPAAYRLRDGSELTFDTQTGEREPRLMAPHQFGDTKYRRVSYTLTATTPFREDFPAGWIDQKERLSVTSNVFSLDVPSSAPPKLPDLHYVVPTMGWSVSEEEGSRVIGRRGGGLRIWMGRGWWSSGEGELLGVVVGSGVISPKGPEYPFVSLIGQDLIRRSAPLRNLRPKSFRGDPLIAERMSLVGAPTVGTVSVVGVAPQYDDETKRWFADIEIDTGEAYAPFVRLSLVRYQPNSLPGCALSPIVLADIVQPLPNRTATITAAADNPSVRTVTVAGPSYTGVQGRGADPGQDDSVLPAVTVSVQRADAAVADEVMRWQPVEGTRTTLARSVSGTTATWTGQITVPANGGQQRLLIIEEEMLYADAPDGTETVTSRVVYAATAPL